MSETRTISIELAERYYYAVEDLLALCKINPLERLFLDQGPDPTSEGTDDWQVKEDFIAAQNDFAKVFGLHQITGEPCGGMPEYYGLKTPPTKWALAQIELEKVANEIDAKVIYGRVGAFDAITIKKDHYPLRKNFPRGGIYANVLRDIKGNFSVSWGVIITDRDYEKQEIPKGLDRMITLDNAVEKAISEVKGPLTQD